MPGTRKSTKRKSPPSKFNTPVKKKAKKKASKSSATPPSGLEPSHQVAEFIADVVDKNDEATVVASDNKKSGKATKKKVRVEKKMKGKKLKFQRGRRVSGFAGKKKTKAFINSKKFASMPAKVIKLLGSTQLFGKNQWKVARFACEGNDDFSLHGGTNYNLDYALKLSDEGICSKELLTVNDGEYRPYEDGSSGIAKKKLEAKPDLKISTLEFCGTMADSDAALSFLGTVGEMLFLCNSPFVFCKGFFKAHLKVANEEAKPSAIVKTMVETAPRAGIVGAADADFVEQFAEELLELNSDDVIAIAWIKARCAALVAQARATADPDGFDLDKGTKEARDLFAKVKALSKEKKYKKDKRFAALSDWKLAGFFAYDEDKNVVPGLVLPSMVDDEEDEDGLFGAEDEGDDEEEDEEEDEGDGEGEGSEEDE